MLSKHPFQQSNKSTKLLRIKQTQKGWVFFFISKKDVYSKNYFMQRSTKHIKDYKKREKQKQRKKLITKKKRAKEQRERFTRCESPSLRPPVAFPPYAPHQTQRR